MVEIEKPFQFVLARPPSGESAPATDPVGGVARLEDEQTRYWLLSLRENEIKLSRLLDCISLLILDEAFSLIPHPIFPYAPPRAELMRDGRFFDALGAQLSRTTMSMLRLQRVALRIQRKEYLEELMSQFASKGGGKELSLIPKDHWLYDPAFPTFFAPKPPFLPLNKP